MTFLVLVFSCRWCAVIQKMAWPAAISQRPPASVGVGGAVDLFVASAPY